MLRRNAAATSVTNSDERTPLLNNGTTGFVPVGLYGSQSANVTLADVVMGFESRNSTLLDFEETLSTIREERPPAETVQPGSLHLLSAKFESLDYDICENTLMLEEERNRGYNYVVRKNRMRWIVMFLIGVMTAAVACTIDITIEELSAAKFYTLKIFVDKCVLKGCIVLPYLLSLALNIIPITIGSLMVVYCEPVAAGSGIPMVKCYLNGVKVPHIVRVKTLFVKAVGVVLSVLGGVAVGKEGPMIHSGAVIAAGISQGKSTTFQKDLKLLRYFREDHEKRDFVSGGAAAGVAAAFGAPIGGVLFSLEEGASFWNQNLTWRIFFCSMISCFTLNIILSAYHGMPGQLAFVGLLNFGKFEDVNYHFVEIPIFLLMGACGGLFGALFNCINYHITVFRMRYLCRNWVKVLEAVTVAAVTATIGFGMMLFINDCRPLGQDPTKYPVQMYCADGEYNAVAALWFQNPEASVRSFFHDQPESHQWQTVLIFFIFYFLLSCWTYGLSISSGLFIPTLLAGAAWGRLVGMMLHHLFPSMDWVDPGTYALIGSAAQLGGVVRMTISLTVILIEATGNLTLGLPLMFVLMLAKFVGDFFNEGLYDIHIQLAGVPILPWDPPPLSTNIYASEVMSYPVVCLKSVDTVSRIYKVLRDTNYNGFPIVDRADESAPKHGELEIPPSVSHHHAPTLGHFRGIILRWQLIVLLQHKIFDETADVWPQVNMHIFRNAYPRYPTIQHVHIAPREMNFLMDLRPFMNPAPYTVMHSASLPRIFRLFRALGLRHLVVTNDKNEVAGIVTRKDLARYHVWKHRGRMGVEELLISERI